MKVTHCGICHSDLSAIDGAFPCPTPIVLGHEAAGVVESIGAGVRGVEVGDSVVLTPCPPCGRCYWCVRGEASHCELSQGIMTHAFPDGSTGLSRRGQTVLRGLNIAGFAEYALLSETGVVRVPKDAPLDVVCVIGCAVQTGVGAVLNTAKVEEGATVLVLGLGGIGLSVVQGARIAGAARIVGVDPVAARRHAAKAMGATDCLDPGSEDVQARVREITSGIGVDYAFECAGRASLVQAGLTATRNGGTIVCVGAPPLERVDYARTRGALHGVRQEADGHHPRRRQLAARDPAPGVVVAVRPPRSRGADHGTTPALRDQRGPGRPAGEQGNPHGAELLRAA